MKIVDVDWITKGTTNSIKGTSDQYYVRFVGSMDVNKLLKRNWLAFVIFMLTIIFQHVRICLGQKIGR